MHQISTIRKQKVPTAVPAHGLNKLQMLYAFPKRQKANIQTVEQSTSMQHSIVLIDQDFIVENCVEQEQQQSSNKVTNEGRLKTSFMASARKLIDHKAVHKIFAQELLPADPKKVQSSFEFVSYFTRLIISS